MSVRTRGKMSIIAEIGIYFLKEFQLNVAQGYQLDTKINVYWNSENKILINKF